MLDTHARHRLPRGESRSGDSQLPPPSATPAARLCASLLPVALLLLLAPPVGARGLDLCGDLAASLSTGDPDDGEHRELPSLISTLVMTDPLPSVTPVASTALSLSPPAVARGSSGRAYALRHARFFGPASLWFVIRTWFLHR